MPYRCSPEMGALVEELFTTTISSVERAKHIVCIVISSHTTSIIDTDTDVVRCNRRLCRRRWLTDRPSWPSHTSQTPSALGSYARYHSAWRTWAMSRTHEIAQRHTHTQRKNLPCKPLLHERMFPTFVRGRERERPVNIYRCSLKQSCLSTWTVIVS